MESNQIVLRIYGGAIDGGFNPKPLVSVGPLASGYSPTPPSLVDESQSWMIVHAQDYTLYALHSRSFQTADGAPGMLLICLFLPPQLRIGDGKSPLGVLDSLQDHFRVLGAAGGKLPGGELDSSPFRALLKLYPLEERPVALPIMQGPSPASFCVESRTQLDALMRHSRYDPLAKVGRLEIGYACETTVPISTTGKAVKLTPRKSAEQKPKEEVKPVAEKAAPAEQSAGEQLLALSPDEKPAPAKKRHLSPAVWAIGGGVALALLFIFFVGYKERKEAQRAYAAVIREASREAEDLVEQADSFISDFDYSVSGYPVDAAKALVQESVRIQEGGHFKEFSTQLQSSVNGVSIDLYGMHIAFLEAKIQMAEDHAGEGSLKMFDKYFYKPVKTELDNLTNVYGIDPELFELESRQLKDRLDQVYKKAGKSRSQDASITIDSIL